MPRKVRVVTTSFHQAGGSASENRDFACWLADAAAAERANLLCLPETFLDVGVPREKRPTVEAIDGPTVGALSERARRHRMWIVAPISVPGADGRILNSAFLLDRDGTIAAHYVKVHPTIGECEDRRMVPGTDTVVAETDFGRLGFAICYDIGWPAHWAALRDQRAELVVWPSAYDGGFPLNAYAWTHGYHVISAVATEHAKIIDPLGRELASTSRWSRLTAATIDLDGEIFHIDDQVERLARLQHDLGARVRVETFTEEHLFRLSSEDDELSLAEIKERYGLENFADYHRRAAAVQDRHRAARESQGIRHAR
jgi:predicted amidohydrolase